MPCYTNQTATVLFGKNTDPELLQMAMQSLSIDYTFDRATGQLTYNTRWAEISEIKRAYSEQVITQTAKRNGWSLAWSVNASGNRQAEVQRASR